jgi:hypothetical protein
MSSGTVPAIADAAVEAAVDHIDHTIADGDLDLHVRIAFKEGRQDRANNEIRGLCGDAQPDPSYRRVAKPVQHINRPADLVERLKNRRAKLLAGGCQSHAAGSCD